MRSLGALGWGGADVGAVVSVSVSVSVVSVVSVSVSVPGGWVAAAPFFQQINKQTNKQANK